jgi:hypothetical protein
VVLGEEEIHAVRQFVGGIGLFAVPEAVIPPVGVDQQQFDIYSVD